MSKKLAKIAFVVIDSNVVYGVLLMIDAKQGVKPIKVIKVLRELYSKNHVYHCFQSKIIVFCSPEFSTSLSFL